MFDTCNCEKSEDCMCAALSSYVRACAAKGVLLTGWRSKACSKFYIPLPFEHDHPEGPTQQLSGTPTVNCVKLGFKYSIDFQEAEEERRTIKDKQQTGKNIKKRLC